MSVRDNVRIGDLSRIVSDEEIWDALAQVGLDKKIQSFGQGLDTVLGELDGGMGLSKGQWQRLAVARLLVKKDADIWILDEPAAYLDPISEIELYQVVNEMADFPEDYAA